MTDLSAKSCNSLRINVASSGLPSSLKPNCIQGGAFSDKMRGPVQYERSHQVWAKYIYNQYFRIIRYHLMYLPGK